MSDTIIILPEPFSTQVQVEQPRSAFTRPRSGELPSQRRSLEIGYYNRIRPSEGSGIWRIGPCK